MTYKVGIGNVKPSFDYESTYRVVMATIDPMAVLEHYGARHIYRNNDELIHSCLIDQVEPHHASGDESPSAALNAESKLYSCFSMGGGDLVWLIMHMEKLDRRSALQFLTRFLSGDSQEHAQTAVEMLAAIFAKPGSAPVMATYSTIVLRPWRFLHPYMASRGIDEATQIRYQVGFDQEENKIVIPHFYKGKLVGWQKRRLDPPWGEDDDSPKYKSSLDFPRESTLYNLDAVKARGLKKVVLVESPMSVLKAESLGLTNVVASFGSKVTKAQAEHLKQFTDLTIFLDNDFSGWSGVGKVYQATKNCCRVRIVDGLDKDMADFDSLAELTQVLDSAEMGCLIVHRFTKRMKGN